ncbi:MAG TPA: caspase family protein, partial [Candidatus Caenarcaniphilales bacterium]
EQLQLLPAEATAVEANVLKPYQTHQKLTEVMESPEQVTKAQGIVTLRAATGKLTQQPDDTVAVSNAAVSVAVETEFPQLRNPPTAKVALLVGVSDYGTGFHSLPGAQKDVEALQQVLQHPQSSFTSITPLLNPDPLSLQQAIEALFGDRQSTDLLLFYFSGRALQDERGKLYLTTSITCKNPQDRLVKSTTVPVSFLQEIIGDSQSKQKIVLLDCWYSNVLTVGKADQTGIGNSATTNAFVNIEPQLGGQGQVILTSSTSTEGYCQYKGTGLSAYTHYLIEGLETGAADLDGDGVIDVEELHTYTAQRVQAAAPATRAALYKLQPASDKILLSKAPIADLKLKYRKQVERLIERGRLSIVSRSILDVVREQLQLLPAEATAVEANVLKPYQDYQSKLQQYAQVLAEVTHQESPLPEQTRNRLKRLQQSLGLRHEDIEPIEAQMARQLKAVSSLEAAGSLTAQQALPREKDSQLLIKVSIAAAVLTFIGAIYGFGQWRDWRDVQRLQTGETFAAQKQYEACMVQAQIIPQLSRRYTEAQSLLKQCQAGANWQNVQVKTLAGHADTVWSVAISPDGQTLASGSGDQTIKLWNLQTGKLRHTLSGHADTVWSVAISPDGQTLVSGSGDQTIKLWNLQTGRLERTFSGHTNRVISVTISPDGQMLGSGSADRTAKVWQLHTGKLLYTLSGNPEGVHSISISGDGQVLASSGRGIKVWNLGSGELLNTLSQHSE